MDFQKTCEKTDRGYLSDIYRINGRILFGGIRFFYKDVSASTHVNGVVREGFEFGVVIGQGCVISQGLLNMHMNDGIRKLEARAGDLGVKLKVMDVEQSLNILMHIPNL